MVQQADWFLYNSIRHALERFEDGQKYEKLHLNTSCITHPLKALLSRPDKDVLLQLRILESRYTRYRVSDLAQGREFSIETGFLSLLNGHSAPGVATQLTEAALNDFSSLCINSVLTYDNKLQSLGARWDRLCHDAQDLATVECFTEKLSELSNVSTTVDTGSICELTCFSEPAGQAELLFAFSDPHRDPSGWSPP